MSRLQSLPEDSVVLPIGDGGLLVSRSHAVFCHVPDNALSSVERVLAGEAALDSLDLALIHALETHAFFEEPRPAEPTTPTVQLQLTNACNLRCDYCCTNSGDPRQKEVSLEQLLAVVASIPEVKGENTSVGILGGEPFTVPWIFELIDAVLDRELELTIFSNGVPLADPAMAEKAAERVKRGALLRLSLAGPTKTLCDLASGAPRFDAVLQALDLLAAHDAKASLDMMLIPQHVEALIEQLPALRKRIPDGTKITLGVLYLSGRERGEHTFGSPAELERALDRVAFEAGEHIAAPERKPVTYRRDACSCAMGHHLHVRSDGALFSCFKMEEAVGHLDQAGFETTAKQVQSHPLRAIDSETCRECQLASICGGGCRSDNVLYTGDGSQPFCDDWRVRTLCELLAEDHVSALEWPISHLWAEAQRRGLAEGEAPVARYQSLNLKEP
jgi:radical SAM protein with 4Fe4S-binding SPASM domain